jgi:hypothetical protein
MLPAVPYLDLPEGLERRVVVRGSPNHSESSIAKLRSECLEVPHPEVMAVAQPSSQQSMKASIAGSVAKEGVVYELDCRVFGAVASVLVDHVLQVRQHKPKSAALAEHTPTVPQGNSQIT